MHAENRAWPLPPHTVVALSRLWKTGISLHPYYLTSCIAFQKQFFFLEKTWNKYLFCENKHDFSVCVFRRNKRAAVNSKASLSKLLKAAVLIPPASNVLISTAAWHKYKLLTLISQLNTGLRALTPVKILYCSFRGMQLFPNWNASNHIKKWNHQETCYNFILSA